MIPVAVDAAVSLGANGFAFLLVVMFAPATSFSAPIGYQTNLMVYGPGGYEFLDFVKVGAPLQLLLAVVTTAGIALLRGFYPASRTGRQRSADGWPSTDRIERQSIL